jgi:zinc protease
VNLWSSFRGAPPQRRARLYRALVEGGVASAVQGALLPTAEPFLYAISATVTEGVALASVESILLEELDRVRANGVTAEELQRAKKQLQARFVFDSDSVTNIAHQLGYFETVATVDVYTELASRVEEVTLDAVAAIARTMLQPAGRTIGWYDPLPVSAPEG